MPVLNFIPFSVGGGGGGSLQSAYNIGNTIVEAGALPVAISSTTADGSHVVTIVKDPPAPGFSGDAIHIDMGSHTSGAGMEIFQAVPAAGPGSTMLFVNGRSGTTAVGFQQSSPATGPVLGVNNNGTGIGIQVSGNSTLLQLNGGGGTIIQVPASIPLVANHPILDAAQQWNNAAVSFKGILLNVTNTASLATSRLIDLQTAGVTEFNVDAVGNALVGQGLDVTTATGLKLGTTNATSIGMGQAVSSAGTFQVFINQGGATLHGSGSGVQYSSTTASRAQYRVNQYGNNAGVPGISTFKSRGTNVGDLLGVVDGDVLYRATCVGVAGDNVSIPLAGFISIQVPTGGSNPGQAWVATDYALQLVPLGGPINSRRQVFRITSEAALELIDGTTAAVAPANKGQIRYNNTSKVFESSVDTGPWTPFGNGLTVTAYVANTALTGAQSGGVSTNTAAAGEVILTLPAITIGMSFSFATTTAQYLRIAASGGATINMSTLASAVNGFTRSNLVGSTVRLIAVSATQWMALGLDGTWTVDT